MTRNNYRGSLLRQWTAAVVVALMVVYLMAVFFGSIYLLVYLGIQAWRLPWSDIFAAAVFISVPPLVVWGWVSGWRNSKPMAEWTPDEIDEAVERKEKWWNR